MANFNVRVPNELAARFDDWAGFYGGRSPALRFLINRAVTTGVRPDHPSSRLPKRAAKLTVRLAAEDSRGLGDAAVEMGLTPNAWAAAVIRRRLSGRPTFRRADEIALLSIQTELRRIGVNVNQIARALNTAVLDGRALELEIAYLDDLRTEIRTHMVTLRQVIAGNLNYWKVER